MVSWAATSFLGFPVLFVDGPGHKGSLAPRGMSSTARFPAGLRGPTDKVDSDTAFSDTLPSGLMPPARSEARRGQCVLPNMTASFITAHPAPSPTDTSPGPALHVLQWLGPEAASDWRAWRLSDSRQTHRRRPRDIRRKLWSALQPRLRLRLCRPRLTSARVDPLSQ